MTDNSVLTAWYQPMGLNLQLISNSQAIVDAAQESFGRFGPAQPVAPPDLTFRLFAHDLDEGPPGPPLFKREGSLLYHTTGRDSTLVADLANGLVYGNFSPTTLQNPAYFRWHFLELAFFQMLEARQWMGVHASALVKEGKALLFRAESGGGKTTLAFAGARHRYQALAEDVVWLAPEQTHWWGMPWSFHLLPDAKNLFPELKGYEPVLQTNQELKLEVNLEDLRPGSTAVQGLPQGMVFVERRPGGQSTIEPITSTQAHALWPRALTGTEMQAPYQQIYLEKLLSSQPGYRLYFGDDIEQALDLLGPLFA